MASSGCDAVPGVPCSGIDTRFETAVGQALKSAFPHAAVNSNGCRTTRDQVKSAARIAMMVLTTSS